MTTIPPLQIDHVEVFVPDRFEAAAWYERVLGLRILDEYSHWADDPRGPLMISADQGRTKLALFEGQPQGTKPTAGFHLVAFRVDAEGFLACVDRLAECGVRDRQGRPYRIDSVVDHQCAYSIYFSDPNGHRLEITTYDYDRTRSAVSARQSGSRHIE
jgi:catechol 2,3-dioxygenase-like lactoylglutathione lyase family enzyme